MKLAVCALLLVACWTGSVHSHSTHSARASQESSVTPIQKVIELLNGMLSKGKAEKHDEEVRFAAFNTWCDRTGAEKARDIQAGADKIQELDAAIAQAEADAEQLGEEIAELDAQVNQWTQEKDKATALRNEENKEYAATHLDYSESIDALKRAIQVLKARTADAPQATSLIEVRKVAAIPRLPSEARHALTSFLQSDANAAAAAPEANAYEFQSSGVIDMLEKLLGRFVDERRVLEKEEMNRKHAFEMLAQKITDDVGYATKTRSEKAALRGTRKEDAAQAKGELASTTEAKATDEKYLTDMKAECKQKSADFTNRQNLRAAELEAIQKAIDIISSKSVTGAGGKYLPSSFVQQQRAFRSLSQLRSKSSTPATPQAKAAAMLLERAKSEKSQLLFTVANRMSEDPFGKVKKMIKDLITRLMEEANEEADHKAWCDTELSTNQQTREQKSDEAETLTSTVDELTAKEAKLAEEIAALSDTIADIKASVAERTTARADEKEKNAVTVADAKEAQAAVTEAIRILKEFYSEASSATSFSQQVPSEDAPATFDEAYTGMQAENGGVIGMLEVINSDFARLEAETSSDEEQAQNEFEAFEADSAQDIEVKDREARHKGFDKTRTVRDLNAAKKQLKLTQEELTAALDYYDKLKPSCIGSTPSYEDRTNRRKEEIASLQEALKILSGEDLS